MGRLSSLSPSRHPLSFFFPLEQLLYFCSVQNVVIQFEILTFLCLHLFMAGYLNYPPEKSLSNGYLLILTYISLDSAFSKQLSPGECMMILVTLYRYDFTFCLSFVKNGSSFLKTLALGSLQFVGLCGSSSLPVLSPKLYHGPTSGSAMPTLMSMAAGLPHFSTGFMRCWGRDTFIALRGLLIITGRYQDARYPF